MIDIELLAFSVNNCLHTVKVSDFYSFFLLLKWEFQWCLKQSNSDYNWGRLTQSWGISMENWMQWRARQSLWTVLEWLYIRSLVPIINLLRVSAYEGLLFIGRKTSAHCVKIDLNMILLESHRTIHAMMVFGWTVKEYGMNHLLPISLMLLHRMCESYRWNTFNGLI